MGYLRMRDRLARTACLTFGLAGFLGAQPPPFEVATVRVAAASPNPEASGRDRVDLTSTSVSLRNASLNFLIQWAYDVPFYQVSGPDWMKDQRYDIQGKPPASSSETEVRLMLRALLTDRFKLVLHREQRPRLIYSLVTKGSLKLKAAAAADAHSFGVSAGDFVFRATTMTEFADQLSDFATVDRPVIDKTGCRDDSTSRWMPRLARSGVERGHPYSQRSRSWAFRCALKINL
jgi:uncharacterized protein (TIGR03435 family)